MIERDYNSEKVVWKEITVEVKKLINVIGKNNNNTVLACNIIISYQINTLNTLIITDQLFDKYNKTKFHTYRKKFE